MKKQELKIALVYDRVNKWGGAERVLLKLHEMFPDAPLYTSLYNPETAKWADDFDVRPSLINRIRLLRGKHEWLAPLMPIIFEAHDFSEFDLVISVTSEAAKGIITGVNTKHVCICLTPTRYLWSHFDDYFSSLIKRSVGYIYIKYLRWWDKVAAQRPDVMIGISTEVCRRIEKYYDRDSVLIYPPVAFDQYGKKPLFRGSVDDSSHKNLLLGGPPPKAESASRRILNLNHLDFYLVVSRLVKYKKVDLVIDAFNETGKKLIIVGKGKEEKGLKNMANKNITFIKDISDNRLNLLYKNAKALIAPQHEDFGLVMVEAMQMGTPVIAYNGGGACDIVIDKKNGLLFDSQSKKDIIIALKRFESLKFVKKDIIKSTKRFSKRKFKKNLMKVIKNL